MLKVIKFEIGHIFFFYKSTFISLFKYLHIRFNYIHTLSCEYNNFGFICNFSPGLSLRMPVCVNSWHIQGNEYTFIFYIMPKKYYEYKRKKKPNSLTGTSVAIAWTRK